MIGSDEKDEYNSVGVRKTVPFDRNPTGNKDINYNAAKRPTKGGSLLPGQTIADLTFMSGYSQRRIRITMNPGDDPVQDPGSIAIMNENGDILWSAGDATQQAINFVRPQTDITGILIMPQVETTATMLDIEIPFPASTSDGIFVGNAGLGNGIVVDVLTGRGVEITTDGGFPLVTIDLDPAGGTFERVLLTTGGAGPVVAVSDGTSPNGVLTAPKGSICLNASATGQIAYNTDGADAWTLAT